MRARILVSAIVSLVALSAAHAEPFAYVANSLSNNVSVIDTASHSVTATVVVGSAPGSVAITPDGNFAYVTNFGTNDISVIDTASNTVIATVPVGLGPDDVAITPDGNFAYITNSSSGNVSVVAPDSNTGTGMLQLSYSATRNR